jgi:hypothetical protein
MSANAPGVFMVNSTTRNPPRIAARMASAAKSWSRVRMIAASRCDIIRANVSARSIAMTQSPSCAFAPWVALPEFRRSNRAA